MVFSCIISPCKPQHPLSSRWLPTATLPATTCPTTRLHSSLRMRPTVAFKLSTPRATNATAPPTALTVWLPSFVLCNQLMEHQSQAHSTFFRYWFRPAGAETSYSNFQLFSIHFATSTKTTATAIITLKFNHINNCQYQPIQSIRPSSGISSIEWEWAHSGIFSDGCVWACWYLSQAWTCRQQGEAIWPTSCTEGDHQPAQEQSHYPTEANSPSSTYPTRSNHLASAAGAEPWSSGFVHQLHHSSQLFTFQQDT